MSGSKTGRSHSSSGTSNQGGRAHFRSPGGCCICGTKSSSSRFTLSDRYSEHFSECFGKAAATRSGDLCNACVLCVKRWLQRGKTPEFFARVLDSKKGPGPKHMKEITKRARRKEARARQQATKELNKSQTANPAELSSKGGEDGAGEKLLRHGGALVSSTASGAETTATDADLSLHAQTSTSGGMGFHVGEGGTASFPGCCDDDDEISNNHGAGGSSAVMTTCSGTRTRSLARKIEMANNDLLERNNQQPQLDQNTSLRARRSTTRKRKSPNTSTPSAKRSSGTQRTRRSEASNNCSLSREAYDEDDGQTSFSDLHEPSPDFLASLISGGPYNNTRLQRSTTGEFRSPNPPPVDSASICSGMISRSTRSNRRVILSPIRMSRTEETDQLLRKIMEQNSQALDLREVHMAVQRQLRSRNRRHQRSAISTSSNLGIGATASDSWPRPYRVGCYNSSSSFTAYPPHHSQPDTASNSTLGDACSPSATVCGMGFTGVSLGSNSGHFGGSFSGHAASSSSTLTSGRGSSLAMTPPRTGSSNQCCSCAGHGVAYAASQDSGLSQMETASMDDMINLSSSSNCKVKHNNGPPPTSLTKSGSCGTMKMRSSSEQNRFNQW